MKVKVLFLIIIVLSLSMIATAKSLNYYEDWYEITAYTHTGERTASDVYPYIGSCAVDNSMHRFGTKFYVPGYGYAIAEDTGGMIQGKILDVFMDTEAECIQWGRRYIKIKIYY